MGRAPVSAHPISPASVGPSGDKLGRSPWLTEACSHQQTGLRHAGQNHCVGTARAAANPWSGYGTVGAQSTQSGRFLRAAIPPRRNAAATGQR